MTERVSFIAELKRRRVFRVATVYCVSAFAMIQAADLILPRLGVPDSVVTVIVVLGLFGLPVALVLSWLFERGPDGIERTETPSSALPVRPVAWAALGAVTAIVVLGAYATIGGVDLPGGSKPERSIAVLPFDNMSGDPANEYFSDGIAEDLLTGLAGIPGLRVVSRTSVMAYKGTTKTMRQVGEELGVAYVVEGSVRRDGNRVRISAQLIEAEEDGHLWAERYDRELTDVFAIQAEIASEIAEQLEARLTTDARERLASVPTTSLEAYDLLLRARQKHYEGNPADLRAALADLQRATELDPEFALAWGWLGWSHVYATYILDEAHRDSARTAALRALELDADLPIGWVALGGVAHHLGRLDSAAAAYRQAVRLQPNNPEAVGSLAAIELARGRYDESLRWGARAAEVEPTNAILVMGAAYTYLYLGQDSFAIERAERAARMDPGSTGPLSLLAFVDGLNGRHDEARRRLESALPTSADPATIHLELVNTAMLAGDWAAARAHLARGLALRPAVAGHWLIDRALIESRLGTHPDTITAALSAAEAWALGRVERGDIDNRPRLFLAVAAALRSDHDEAIRWMQAAYDHGLRGFGLIERTYLADDPFVRDPRYLELKARADADIARMWQNVVRNGWYE